MCCGKDSEAIWSKHRRQILLDGGVDGGVVIGLSVYQHIYIFFDSVISTHTLNVGVGRLFLVIN